MKVSPGICFSVAASFPPPDVFGAEGSLAPPAVSLTPPLGWNSWNCWGREVSQEKVLRSARALVAAGLDRHGWSYINIDDGWQGNLRVYAKPLDDGSCAVGFFNLGAEEASVVADWPDLKLNGPQRVRDLWRQKDLGVFAEKFTARAAPHGVVLVRIFSAP